MPTKTQALQDALELCVKEMCKYCQESAEAMAHAIPCFNGCETMRIAKEALDMPLRNCDVGTAEEQGERCLAQFDQWRSKGGGKKLITAIMEWAQMPYEAEEGGAK